MVEARNMQGRKGAHTVLPLLLLLWIGAVHTAQGSPRADEQLLRGVRTADTGRVQASLEAGADPNARDSRGWPPLGYAAMAGHQTIAELLIAAGANVDAPTHNGDTPLIVASVMGQAPLVRVLLAAGADVRATNDAGDDALRKAIQYGHDEIVALLEAARLGNVPRTDATASSSASSDTPGVQYVLRKDGIIRAGAGVKSKRLGALAAGTRVVVRGKEGDWYRIEHAGLQGYMYERLFQEPDPPLPGTDPSPGPPPDPVPDAPSGLPLERVVGTWSTDQDSPQCQEEFLEIRSESGRLTLEVYTSGDSIVLADRMPVLDVEGNRIQIGTESFRWNLEPEGDRLRYRAQNAQPVVYFRCLIR